MSIKKKLITFVMTFAMVLSLVPELSVQAATTDFKIISDSKVTVEQAKKWAKSRGATETFVNLADIYFRYSSNCGNVNPAIAYVQSAKETGYGNFGGVIDESYHNPCGLKISAGGGDTDKNAHQKFDSWDIGVQAHMDHLALYAGASRYPKNNTYDPRHFATIKGKSPTVNSLGTKWAPSATYGQEINALYKNLMDFAGVDYPKESGWIQTGSDWIYLKDDGKMLTGWLIYNGDSYYLDLSTGKMATNTTIDGYKIGSDGKKQTTTNKTLSNNKKTIAVDAGHDYGKDYGVEKTIDKIKYIESDLNIQVAVKLKSELEKRGYNVVMTREEGQKPSYGSLNASLTHKVKVANDSNADFFISIHHNSAGILTAEGVETYYSIQPKDDNYGGGTDSARLEKSKKITQIINDSIVNKIGATNRGVKNDAGSDVGTLFVLRNANMPASLVETGFLTNSEEAKRCANADIQQKVAEAIAQAISENI